MLLEYSLGAFDDHVWKAGETGYFNAVTLACRTGFNGVEEDDAAGCLFDTYTEIAHAGELFGEHCQLVIMSREEGARAGFSVKILDCGPGEREAVEGCSAAAHFI